MGIALVGARVFDGERIREDTAVVLEGRHIAAIGREAELPRNIERRRIEGLLAPGFVDVQVNGGGGVLFNADPSVAAIRAIGAAHRRFGTAGFLPTFITDAREKMAAAIGAVRAALEAEVPGVLGIHLEGPFLNPARKGVHDAGAMRPIGDDDIALLASLGRGRTLVTLAPEMVPMEAIARLAAAGVVLAAGHTAAPYETVKEARRHGVTGFTHLFNAMPPLTGRAPGPVAAALEDRESYCGIIADLHHVAPATFRVALAARGPDRMMLVTDAMPTVGTDLARFDLLGQTVHRANGKLTTADGTLAGSDLDMATAVRNAVGRVGVRIEDALRMASLAPAGFLGLDRERGRIAPGYRADLVLLDERLAAVATWIGGAAQEHGPPLARP
ncbi:MAG TPA: N-acetylglucosamine-6-phosphate deacetylase [Alphaproteobacteria bacterium]|jgi:N-acetylglucosamine-6-phosphate deacetylase